MESLFWMTTNLQSTRREYKNLEIASALGVGVRTVETHRERIMRKLNIHSVAGLTKFSVSKGLIILPEENTLPAGKRLISPI